MLALGRERDEVSVVDDQRGCPTYVGHLADATRELVALPYGTYHVAADGDCTWAEFAEAIFEEAGHRLPCPPYDDGGARPPGAPAGVLRAALGEAGDAAPAALAAGPSRLPG